MRYRSISSVGSASRRPARRARGNNTPGKIYLYAPDYTVDTATSDSGRVYVYGSDQARAVIDPARTPQRQGILQQAENGFAFLTQFNDNYTTDRVKQYIHGSMKQLKEKIRQGVDVVWPKSGLTRQSNLARLGAHDLFIQEYEKLLQTAADTVEQERPFSEDEKTGPAARVAYKKDYYPSAEGVPAAAPAVPTPFEIERGVIPPDAWKSLTSWEDDGNVAVLLPMNAAAMRMAGIAASVHARWPAYHQRVCKIIELGKDLDPRLAQKTLSRGRLNEENLGQFLRQHFMLDSQGMPVFIDAEMAKVHGKLLAVVRDIAWDVSATAPQLDRLPDFKQLPFVGRGDYLPLGLEQERRSLTLTQDIGTGSNKQISYGILDGRGMPRLDKDDLVAVNDRVENREFLAPIVSLGQDDNYTFHAVGTGALRDGGISLVPLTDQTALGITQAILRSNLADFSGEESRWKENALVVFGLPGPEQVDGSDTDSWEFASSFVQTVHVYEGSCAKYDNVTLRLTYAKNGSIASGVLSLDSEAKRIRHAVMQQDGSIVIKPFGMRPGYIKPISDGFSLTQPEIGTTVLLSETKIDLVQTARLAEVLTQGIQALCERASQYPEATLTFMQQIGISAAASLVTRIKSMRAMYGGSEKSDDTPNIADALDAIVNNLKENLKRVPLDPQKPEIGSRVDELEKTLDAFAKESTSLPGLYFSEWAGLAPSGRSLDVTASELATAVAAGQAFAPSDADAQRLGDKENYYVLTYSSPRRLYKVTNGAVTQVTSQYEIARVLGQESILFRKFARSMEDIAGRISEFCTNAFQGLTDSVGDVRLEIRGGYAWIKDELVQATSPEVQPRYFLPASAYYGDPKVLREVAAYRHDLARSVGMGIRVPTLTMLGQAAMSSTRMRPLARRIQSADSVYNVSSRREVYERARATGRDVQEEFKSRQAELRRGILDDADAEITERATGAPALRTDVPLLNYLSPRGNLALTPVENTVISVYGVLNPVNLWFMKKRHDARVAQGLPGDVAYLAFLRHQAADEAREARALKEFSSLDPMAKMESKLRAPKEVRAFSAIGKERSDEELVAEMLRLGVIAKEGGLTDDEKVQYSLMATELRNLKGKPPPVIRVLRAKDINGRVIEQNKFTLEKVKRKPEWVFVYATDADNLSSISRNNDHLLSMEAMRADNALPFAVENVIYRAVKGGNVGLGYTVNLCSVCGAAPGSLCWDLESETPKKLKMGEPPHDARLVGDQVPATPQGAEQSSWQSCFTEVASAYLVANLAIQAANIGLQMAERTLRMAEERGVRSQVEEVKQTVNATRREHAARVHDVEEEYQELVNEKSEQCGVDADVLQRLVEKVYGVDATLQAAKKHLQATQARNVAKMKDAMAQGKDLVVMDSTGLVDLQRERRQFEERDTAIEINEVKHGLLAAARPNPRGRFRRARGNTALTVDLFPEMGLFYQCSFTRRELTDRLLAKKRVHDEQLRERAERLGSRKTIDFSRYMGTLEWNILTKGEEEVKYLFAPVAVADRLDLRKSEVVSAPVGSKTLLVQYIGNMDLEGFLSVGGVFIGKEKDSLFARTWKELPETDYAIFVITESGEDEELEGVSRVDLDPTITDVALAGESGKTILHSHIVRPRGSVVSYENQFARSLGLMSFAHLANLLGVRAVGATAQNVDAAGVQAWSEATKIPVTGNWQQQLAKDRELLDWIEGRRELCIYEISAKMPTGFALDELRGFNQARALLEIVMEESGVVKPLPGGQSSLSEIWAFLNILRSLKDEEKDQYLADPKVKQDMREAARLTQNEGARLEAPFALAGTLQVALNRLAQAAPSAPRPLNVTDNVGFLNFVLPIPSDKRTKIPDANVILDGAGNLNQGLYGIRTLSLPAKANTSITNQLVLAGWSNQLRKMTSIALMPARLPNPLSFEAVVDTKAFKTALDRVAVEMFNRTPNATSLDAGKATYYKLFDVLLRGGMDSIASLAIESAERRTNAKVSSVRGQLVAATSSDYRMLPSASDVEGSIFYESGKLARLPEEQQHPNDPKWWAGSLIELVIRKKLEYIIIPDKVAQTQRLANQGTYLMQVGPILFQVVATREGDEWKLKFKEHQVETEPVVTSLFQRMADLGVRMPDPLMTWDQAAKSLDDENADFANDAARNKAIQLEIAKDKVRYLKELKGARAEFMKRVGADALDANRLTPYRHAPTSGYLIPQLSARAESANLLDEAQAREGQVQNRSAEIQEFATPFLEQITRANPRRARRARMPRRNPLKDPTQVDAVIDYASGKEDQEIYNRANAALKELVKDKPAGSWDINREVVKRYFPRQGAEQPSAWTVKDRLRSGLSPEGGVDLISRMGRVKAGDVVGSDSSGAPLVYSLQARELATSEDPFYMSEAGLKLVGQNAEMSVEEAKNVLAQQRRKIEHRGEEGRNTIQAASAVCKTLRRRKLTNFEIPVPILQTLQEKLGDASKSILILMSPRLSTGNSPLAVPRVMTWRRLDHIDCDMVGKDPGDLVELLGKSIQSALYWLVEKFERRKDISIIVGRVGDANLQIAWQPGDRINIDTVTNSLRDPSRRLPIQGATLDQDVARYDQAERELNIGNYKSAKTKSSAPQSQSVKPSVTPGPAPAERSAEKGPTGFQEPTAESQVPVESKTYFPLSSGEVFDATGQLNKEARKELSALLLQVDAGTPQVVQAPWLNYVPTAFVTIKGNEYSFRRNTEQNSDEYLVELMS